MRYLSFLTPKGEAAFGRVDGQQVVRLTGADDLKSAIASGSLADLAGGESFDLAGLTLLPVIPNPGKIICIGLNYESHRQETGRPMTTASSPS